MLYRRFTDSSLLAFLALLCLLLLGEGVDHKEFAVSWIPLLLKVTLLLIWHEHGPFESLHDRNVDIVLILLIALVIWPGQIVANGLDLLKSLLTRAISSILRYKVEALRQIEVWQR